MSKSERIIKEKERESIADTIIIILTGLLFIIIMKVQNHEYWLCIQLDVFVV